MKFKTSSTHRVILVSILKPFSTDPFSRFEVMTRLTLSVEIFLIGVI